MFDRGIVVGKAEQTAAGPHGQLGAHQRAAGANGVNKVDTGHGKGSGSPNIRASRHDVNRHIFWHNSSSPLRMTAQMW